MTLLPQFIGPGDAVLARSLSLAGIHIALGIVWLTWYVYVLGRLHAVLARAEVRRWLERATGTVLIALGLRLAWTRR